MEPLARTLMVVGGLLVVVGVLLYLGPSVPLLGWLGKLPGDIRIERTGMRVYLPVTSCLLVSVVLSALFWLASRLR